MCWAAPRLNLASAKTQQVIPGLLERTSGAALKNPAIPERTAARKQDSASVVMPRLTAPMHELPASASAVMKPLSAL